MWRAKGIVLIILFKNNPLKARVDTLAGLWIKWALA